jgi:hypothetical protein
MPFSAANVITEVRRLIQDTATPVRYTDEVLVGFVNQTLYKMLMLRPDIFSHINSAVPVTGNNVMQVLPADATQLIEIFSVTSQSTTTAVTEGVREIFDQTHPGWVNDPAARPTTFMRHKRNALRYMLYPRPTANATITMEYARVPATVNNVAITSATKADNIRDVSDVYFPIVVDGTVYMCESVDDENVNSNRARASLEAFLAALGASAESKNAIGTTAPQTLTQRPAGVSATSGSLSS